MLQGLLFVRSYGLKLKLNDAAEVKMSTLDTTEQILQEQAGLIHRVVMHCSNPGSVPDLELVLQQAEDNDWTQLVTVIRDLISGNRGASILEGLDDEDRIIVDAILRGLEDPQTLPHLQVDFESHMTAPGIAGLVYVANSGHAQAQQILVSMTNQLIQGGGDLGAAADRIRPLAEGERDLEKLSEGLSDNSRKLIVEILQELRRFEAH